MFLPPPASRNGLEAGEVRPAEVTRLHATDREWAGERTGLRPDKSQIPGAAGPPGCCWVCGEDQAGGPRGRLRGAACEPGQWPSSRQALEAGHSAISLCCVAVLTPAAYTRHPKPRPPLPSHPPARALPQVPRTRGCCSPGRGAGGMGRRTADALGRASGGGRCLPS